MTELTRHGRGERGVFRVTKHENEKRKATPFAVRMWRRLLRKLGLGERCEVRKAQRGCWLWDSGTFIPYMRKRKDVNAPVVFKDEVDPFRNHATGQVETSMSTYRKHLKQAGFFEKGNDRIPQKKLPTRQERFEEIREQAKEAKRQAEWGMAKSTSDQRELWKQEQEKLDYKI